MFKVIMTVFLSAFVFQAGAMLEILKLRSERQERAMHEWHKKNLTELISFFNRTVMVTAYGFVEDIVKQEQGHSEMGHCESALRVWFLEYRAKGIPDATLCHHARQIVAILREEKKLNLEQKIKWISFIGDINQAYSLTLKNDCLIWGAYLGNTRLVVWAVQNGAQLETEYRPLLTEVRPGFRATALYWAREKKHPVTARYLITHGATDPRLLAEEPSAQG